MLLDVGEVGRGIAHDQGDLKRKVERDLLKKARKTLEEIVPKRFLRGEVVGSAFKSLLAASDYITFLRVNFQNAVMNTLPTKRQRRNYCDSRSRLNGLICLRTAAKTFSIPQSGAWIYFAPHAPQS